MEPEDKDAPRPPRRAVTATRARDMGLLIVAVVAGAAVAPFGSPVAGVLGGTALVAALRLAMPTGDRHRQEHRPAAPPDTPGPASGEGVPLDRLPLALLLIDGEATVTFCSDDARALLARDPVGQHISVLFRAPAVLAAVNRSLTGGGDETIEFLARRPRQRHLRAAVRALDGPARVALTLHDVSQSYRLDAMRMDFVANASHELRTPLAAISGMVETLQGPAREDEANRDRFLGIIAREAARMARLVDDLLSLSRIELQANIAPTTPEDLRPLVAEAVSAMTPLAAENGNTLRVDLGEGPLTVPGERDELIQVFNNLISNAIRYGGADRPIDIVRADAPEGRVAIAIRDRGEGIDPSLVPRLTERFFRVNKRDSISRGGTGLGLAIVKHILTRHGGELRIESVPGEGSRFTVHLPRQPGR